MEKVEMSPQSHETLDPSGAQWNLRRRSRTDPAHRPDVGLNRPQERCCVLQGADEHSEKQLSDPEQRPELT